MKIMLLAMFVLLTGCVSAQLKTTSATDFQQAIAIAQSPDFPNPVLADCLQKRMALIKAFCTTGCGIATTIAEKEAVNIVNSYPACIISDAKIQAFFAKFGIVLPIVP